MAHCPTSLCLHLYISTLPWLFWKFIIENDKWKECQCLSIEMDAAEQSCLVIQKLNPSDIRERMYEQHQRLSADFFSQNIFVFPMFCLFVLMLHVFFWLLMCNKRDILNKYRDALQKSFCFFNSQWSQSFAFFFCFVYVFLYKLSF